MVGFTPEMKELLKTLQENTELYSSINKKKMDDLIERKVQESSKETALAETYETRGFFRYRRKENILSRQNEDLEQQLQETKANKKREGEFLSEWKRNLQSPSIEKIVDRVKEIKGILQIGDNIEEQRDDITNERNRNIVMLKSVN